MYVWLSPLLPRFFTLISYSFALLSLGHPVHTLSFRHHLYSESSQVFPPTQASRSFPDPECASPCFCPRSKEGPHMSTLQQKLIHVSGDRRFQREAGAAGPGVQRLDGTKTLSQGLVFFVCLFQISVHPVYCFFCVGSPFLLAWLQIPKSYPFNHFKCTAQWHKAHSHCHTTVSIHSRTFHLPKLKLCPTNPTPCPSRVHPARPPGRTSACGIQPDPPCCPHQVHSPPGSGRG